MADRFAVIIVCLTALTGLVWLADVLWRRFHGRGKPDPDRRGGWRWFADTCRGFFPLILAVLLIRSFVAEPFHVPSGSLMPTVYVGDFVIAEKFAYGLRLPVTNTQIIPTGTPERGDIFVFRFPEKSAQKFCRAHPACLRRGGEERLRAFAGTHFIKRVIGLPGDRIKYTCDNQLFINGRKVRREYLGIFHGTGRESKFNGAEVWREYLPQEDGTIVQHKILLHPQRPTKCGTWVVPQGEYFAMGDNRDNSEDSRYWGSVPRDHLVGRANLVLFNFQGWDEWPLWGRIGTIMN
ncbi:MAG: signal peptidase I [Gammaproteobacteria bacterium]|nr:signal peptidase I [Gammaproteobacteria bacterium]